MNNILTNTLEPMSTTNQFKTFPLDHLGILCVSGGDAPQFLQGQATADFRTVNQDTGLLGAFCSAKGRVISTFIAIKHIESILLILPLELVAATQKRLSQYILRSKVKLQDYSSTHSLVGIVMEETDEQAILTTPELIAQFSYPCPAPERRFIQIIAHGDTWTTNKLDFSNSLSDWQLLDIKAGIPWLTPSNSEEFIPQTLNLEQLGGISFNKGCYTGQEIVARTHYLGKSKRALFMATVTPPENGDLQIGAAIIDKQQQKLGSVVNLVQQPTQYYLLITLTSDPHESTKLYVTTPETQLEITLFNFNKT